MKTVKENINNMELSILLEYYNKYLNKLKKTFIKGGGGYQCSGSSYHFSTGKSIDGQYNIAVKLSISSLIEKGIKQYMLVINYNAHNRVGVDDGHESFSFIFRIDEYTVHASSPSKGGYTFKMFKLYLREMRRTGWKPYEVTLNWEDVDITKNIMNYPAYSAFYETFFKNLLFFDKEIERRK